MNNTVICSICFLAFLLSCTKDTAIHQDTIASIGSERITVDKVDAIIQNQLYESLYGIYYKRKIATEEYLAHSLILREAEKESITTDALLERELKIRAKKKDTLAFISEHHLEKGIIDPERPFNYFDVRSPQGKRLLRDIYYKKILQDYIAELMTKYDAKITLIPPLPPRKDVAGLHGFPVSSMNGDKPKIWLISDYDCPNCQNFSPIFKDLRMRYASRFDFVHTSSVTQGSLPERVSACADVYGRFWEVHDYIFERLPFDSLDFIKASSRLSLTEAQAKQCLAYSGMDARQNDVLQKLGISLTPTLIIDGRIYYGDYSLEKICEYIDAASRFQ
ncbi:thioredoxin domain-containing protein [Fulvivirgaceae bacterium PWU5]|uniref:Thioredoxin domain-containing protein n=1 Tax=Dawidia cretensis TaxID=2782350 RepID=A0AAP2DXX7_9BACT|nr:thioredoxin domain-containing protein [Dawidia cretensis]MBT1708414.1 thioredoxin domain-containing protein [Dawidia cretensis]